jgi:hypothetical protein
MSLVENYLMCEIKDIPRFRACLESVKFYRNNKNHELQDVVL